MSAIAWNCRGLGNPQTVGALREYVRQYDPKIVFLAKTKMKISRIKRVKVKLDFANGFYVQRKGQGGGLAMFWRREVDIEIKSFSRHHIDSVVTKEGTNFKWRITRFYGNPETHRRKESWNFLNTLNSQFQLPWMCFKDFNEILSSEEKLGGPQDLSIRWRVSIMGSTGVASRIWVIMAQTLHGAASKKGKIECI